MALSFSPLIPALPVAATFVAVLAAATGIALTGRQRVTRLLIPLSGAVLVLAALFGVVPELVRDIGWGRVLSLMAMGFGALMLLDRFAFPVCPSCDHGRPQGFITPLLIAVAIHAFVDGWGLVAVQMAMPRGGNAMAAAILLHKIPEGLALGTILSVLLLRAGPALAWCALAESATLAGGATGLWLTPAGWVSYPLALAAGTFVFLGIQAMRPQMDRT